jgi:hypothetical protein
LSEFYDSARWGLIPAKADAMLYWDGRYAATAEDAKRFGKVRWITVLGGEAAAANAGAIDYENGNLAYEGSQLRAWAAARQEMNCRARVYCNRSDLPRAIAAVDGLSSVSYWIATLDNRKWTAADLIADILALGVTLAEGDLWAVQYAGGMTAEYDTSMLYGTW